MPDLIDVRVDFTYSIANILSGFNIFPPGFASIKMLACGGRSRRGTPCLTSSSESLVTISPISFEAIVKMRYGLCPRLPPPS